MIDPENIRDELKETERKQLHRPLIFRRLSWFAIAGLLGTVLLTNLAPGLESVWGILFVLLLIAAMAATYKFDRSLCACCGKMMFGPFPPKTFTDKYYPFVSFFRWNIHCRHCGFSIRSLKSGMKCFDKTEPNSKQAIGYVIADISITLLFLLTGIHFLLEEKFDTVFILGMFFLVRLLSSCALLKKYRVFKNERTGD